MANIYYRSDFKNISGLGTHKKASCPVCGSTDNVSIDTERGLVHCFTPGCTCNGKYVDEERDEERSEEGRVMSEEIDAATRKKCSQSKRSEKKDNSIPLTFTLRDINTPNSSLFTAQSASLLTPQYPSSAAVVPVYPSDYKGVNPKLLANLYDLSETEGERGNCAALVRDYLTQIGISLDTAQHFGLKAYVFNYADKDTEQKTVDGHSPHHSLCYLTWLQGQCVNLKSRAVDVKAFRNEKANKQLPGVPYNIDYFATPEHRTEPMVFVEGERDVLSLYEAGIASGVSVANGGGEDVRKVLAPFMEWVSEVSDIVVCCDADYAGRLLKMRLLYLFRDRARLCTLPPDCKDISDVLLTYGAERVRQIISEAKVVSPASLVRPVTVAEKVRSNLRGRFDEGYTCGYGEAFDRHLKFSLRGGLAIITGYPGAGKSDFLYDLAAHLISRQHKRFTFFSLEQPDNADAMAGVIRRLVGRNDMALFSDEQLDDFITRLDQYMNCFDVESGDPSVDEIVDICTRNLKLFHPDFLVVDNYARLRRDNVDDQNETEFIRNLLVALQNWGLRNHVWVIVVAHPRKPQDSASAQNADAAAVAGSAHWHNLADLGMTVKRVIDGEQVDYKELTVWKVRDQRLCRPGSVFLLRQACGRYEERDSRDEVESECQLGIKYRDRGVYDF